MNNPLIILFLVFGLAEILISTWGFLKIRKIYTNIDAKKNKKLLLESSSQIDDYRSPKFFSTIPGDSAQIIDGINFNTQSRGINEIENFSANKIKKAKKIIF